MSDKHEPLLMTYDLGLNTRGQTALQILKSLIVANGSSGPSTTSAEFMVADSIKIADIFFTKLRETT